MNISCFIVKRNDISVFFMLVTNGATMVQWYNGTNNKWYYKLK